MPKRSRKRQALPRTRDVNESAFDAVRHIIEESERAGEKNPLAVALGRLGGLKGGKARAERMTPAERRRSALKAAQVRWADHKNKKPEH